MPERHFHPHGFWQVMLYGETQIPCPIDVSAWTAKMMPVVCISWASSFSVLGIDAAAGFDACIGKNTGPLMGAQLIHMLMGERYANFIFAPLRKQYFNGFVKIVLTLVHI